MKKVHVVNSALDRRLNQRLRVNAMILFLRVIKTPTVQYIY